MGWTSTTNKPSKTRKVKRQQDSWDVDSAQAEHIYGRFTAFDMPKSAFDWEPKPCTEDEPHDDCKIRNVYNTIWRCREVRGNKADPEQVERLKTAALMVQNFVDALSGEQSNYTVGIKGEATTASTDLHNRVMTLPATTILDPSITDQEAALLMVAYMGHEIGHIREDNDLDQWLRDDPTIIDRGFYTSLSTILREARVEEGFAKAFPGYAGLFEPLLRWISRGTKDGSKPPKDALGFAVAATRYPFRFDWSNPTHVTERDWWVEWVKQYSHVEDYAGHKAALDLAVDHIKTTLKNQPQDDATMSNPQPGSGQAEVKGSTPMSQQGQPGQPSDDEGKGGESKSSKPSSKPSKSSKTSDQTGQGSGKSPYESMAAEENVKSNFTLDAEKTAIEDKAWKQAEELRQKARDGEIDYGEMYEGIKEIERKAKAEKAKITRDNNGAKKASASIPASIEQYTAAAPKRGKESAYDRRIRERAEEMAVNEANQMLGLKNDGRPAKPLNIGHASQPVEREVETDDEAVGIFRSTFMRLRGGDDGRIGGKRSGRLDDRHIFRLADKRDDRVFTRRGAPKTQHLRVYLMVDTSGSMGGKSEMQIQAVSKALIEASIGADKLALEVWGWDDVVVPVWSQGEDPNEVKRLRARGGTSDAGALMFARMRMQEHLRQDEHGLIIMMSDGQGDGWAALKGQVDKANEKGIAVFGIAMANLDQSNSYGKDGYVQWQGSVAKTAGPLAEIIAQSWATKDQHRQ